jgi:hypothetical protein
MMKSAIDPHRDARRLATPGNTVVLSFPALTFGLSTLAVTVRHATAREPLT